MDRLALNPNALLKPLHDFVVEDLSNTGIIAATASVAAVLSALAAPVSAMLSAAGHDTEDIASAFFPNPGDPGTPGKLLFWPANGRDRSAEQAHRADYSLRAAIFLSERDHTGVVYPAGFNLMLKMEAGACDLVRQIPASVFEQLEFQLKGIAVPGGFEFLDESQPRPAMPNMRRQFLKAIARAHEVTRIGQRPRFEAVILRYIWDECEPEKHFGAVLSTLAALFIAIHRQAKLSVETPVTVRVS